MSERILTDTSLAHPQFSVVILRYFNPVGAHDSGLIGEDPNGVPNNLMPYVTKVAKKELKELSVYGNDYDTPDGTGVRDYIHVKDLADIHIKVLSYLNRKKNIILNCGYQKPSSVLEVINSFKKVTKNKTLELEHSFYLGILFALDFQFHPRADHGGLRIHLGLLGYNVDFQIHDNRHWDGDMNDWH